MVRRRSVPETEKNFCAKDPHHRTPDAVSTESPGGAAEGSRGQARNERSPRSLATSKTTRAPIRGTRRRLARITEDLWLTRAEPSTTVGIDHRSDLSRRRGILRPHPVDRFLSTQKSCSPPGSARDRPPLTRPRTRARSRPLRRNPRQPPNQKPPPGPKGLRSARSPRVRSDDAHDLRVPRHLRPGGLQNDSNRRSARAKRPRIPPISRLYPKAVKLIFWL